MKSLYKAVLICMAYILIFIYPAIAKDGGLFSSEQPLELILEADVMTLIEDKSEEPEYSSASLILKLPGNAINMFDLKVKPRGHTRRLTDLCDFPPLKFNLKKSQIKNTFFDGYDKFKFVSQCRQDQEFQHYVLEEYLLYKTYNILTEESYKTRLVNLTIKDVKLRIPIIQMTGFIIEDDEDLAKRIDAKPFRGQVYSQDSCLESTTDRLSFFQFMIGNTDWYINTKHNTDVFERASDGALLPVPYDFDFSGVINTIYASPSKQIPITQVRQRYFKGTCRQGDDYSETIALFNDKREEIYTLYMKFELLPRHILKQSLRYYDKFYKIINNPDLLETSFYSSCNSKMVKNNHPKNAEHLKDL